MVGCGLHRTTTPTEKAALVGAQVAARLRVVDAQGISQSSVTLGETAQGGVIRMNDAVARADLVVAVGIVEPHLYAGFSGGVKAVAIGCAGQETIAWTHHPVFLDQPAVRLCRLDGNPFQEALREIAAATRLRFALNVVLGDGGGVAGVAAGDPAAVQRRLADDHGAAWIRRHEQPFDLVVAGVPAPKDRSLYQASRAATYVGLAARPVVAARRPDRAAAPTCRSASATGPARRNFGALLAATERPLDLVARGCVEPLGPGGQRAYMMAKLMTLYRVGVIGGGDRKLIEGMGLLALRRSTKRSRRRGEWRSRRPGAGRRRRSRHHRRARGLDAFEPPPRKRERTRPSRAPPDEGATVERSDQEEHGSGFKIARCSASTSAIHADLAPHLRAVDVVARHPGVRR